VLRYGQMMNGYAVEAGCGSGRSRRCPCSRPGSRPVGEPGHPCAAGARRADHRVLQNDCVAQEHDIDRYVPPPAGGLLPYRVAVRLALRRERAGRSRPAGRTRRSRVLRAIRSRAIRVGGTGRVHGRARAPQRGVARSGVARDQVDRRGERVAFGAARLGRAGVDRSPLGGVGMTRGRRHLAA
jgi:hypothetical protein